MTKPASKTLALIATGFLGGTFILCGFAAQTKPNHELRSNGPLSHKVRFSTSNIDFKTGDSITISDVRGTSNELSAGNIYEVKGTYKLVSKDRATLGAFVTTSGKSGGSTPNMRTQMMKVDKGDGRFTLIFYMWQDGDPHVSFYPYGGGNSFGGIYFGDNNPQK
jgi:hypothetical protein